MSDQPKLCRKSPHNRDQCKLPEGHKGPHIWMTWDEQCASAVARAEAQRTEKARAIGRGGKNGERSKGVR